LNSLVYTFTATPSVSGSVTVTGYLFDFGQGKGAESFDSKSVEHDFGQAGTYTVKAQIKTSAGTTAIADHCNVTLTVGPSDQTPPTTPPGQVLGTTTELPDTGAGALAGLAGIGAMGYASRAYINSRRSLIGALRRK
jgi:PKD repeat protein